MILIEAVHRYYESRRRILFTDKRPERVETVKKNRKKLEPRKDNGEYVLLFCILWYVYFLILQLFDSRAKVVRKAEERFWKQLSFSCMSEEDSANEDENHSRYIIRHSPSWRSSGNYCFIKCIFYLFVKLQI